MKKINLLLIFSTLSIAFSGSLISLVTAESVKITVNAGKQELLSLTNLKAGYKITGIFSISGGGNEIRFWVIDPDGNTILNLGTVIQGKSFEFTAQKNGTYTLRFDNSGSSASKVVAVTYDIDVRNVSSLNPYILGGVILIIIIIALLVLAFRTKRT